MATRRRGNDRRLVLARVTAAPARKQDRSEQGVRRTGPETLILIHGLTSNAGFWRENIAGLAEEYLVIAVDRRGTGARRRTPATRTRRAGRRTSSGAELVQVEDAGHLVMMERPERFDPGAAGGVVR